MPMNMMQKMKAYADERKAYRPIAKSVSALPPGISKGMSGGQGIAEALGDVGSATGSTSGGLPPGISGGMSGGQSVAEALGNVGSAIGGARGGMSGDQDVARANIPRTPVISNAIGRAGRPNATMNAMKKGGKISAVSKSEKIPNASKRADGIAQRGKTKGRMC